MIAFKILLEMTMKLNKLFWICLIITILNTPSNSDDLANIMIASHSTTNQLYHLLKQSEITSKICLRTIDYFINNQFERIIFEYLDSSGTFPSGIALDSISHSIGNFDECLAIERFTSLESINIDPQYCLFKLKAKTPKSNREDKSGNNIGLDISMLIGLCLPSSCLLNEIQNATALTNISPVIWETIHCTSKPIESRIKWFHLCIIGFFSFYAIILLITLIVKYIHHKDDVSLYANFMSIFSLQGTRKHDCINCLDGYRSISLIFIILFHSNHKNIAITIFDNPSAFSNTLIGELVIRGEIWVDSFFLMSGFLVAYIALKENGDQQPTSISHKLKNFSWKFVQRYFRFASSQFFVISIFILFDLYVSSPLGYVINNQVAFCVSGGCFWNNFNYFLYFNRCLCQGHTWYLIFDIQYYLVSPLLTFPLVMGNKKWKFIGVSINIAIILLSAIYTFVVMSVYKLPPYCLLISPDESMIDEYYSQVYFSTLGRIGPYCVGILMAVVNYHFNKNSSETIFTPFKSNKIHGVCLVLSFIGIFFIVFFNRFHVNAYDFNNFGSHLYGAIHRDVWAISWAYILLSCINGKLHLINWILSNGVFKVISLVSLQTYLYHPIVVFHSTNAKTFSNETYNVVLLKRFIVNTVISLLIGYVAYYLVELPSIRIGKIVQEKASNLIRKRRKSNYVEMN